jgi:hypothetical protein
VRCWTCLCCDQAIRWHYHSRRPVGHLCSVCHVFDAYMDKGANRPHRRPCLLRPRGCTSWHRNRVLQSAESKEAVVQQEPLEYMSDETTEMRFALSGTMGEVVGGERGRGLCRTHGLPRAAPMEPKITGPDGPPGLTSGSSTGVSVALNPPARTGRALVVWHRRPLNLSSWSLWLVLRFSGRALPARLHRVAKNLAPFPPCFRRCEGHFWAFSTSCGPLRVGCVRLLLGK